MTKERIYKFRDVIVEEADDSLKINLSKKERRKSLFFLIFMPIGAIGVFLWLRGMPTKIDSFKIAMLGIVILIIVAVLYFNSVFKTAKNLRGVVLEKKLDSLLLNGITLGTQSQIRNIIVQPKISLYGFGLSCTIGIGLDKKEVPISFSHQPKEALEIANTISLFLNCGVVEKKPLQFSFYRKW